MSKPEFKDGYTTSDDHEGVLNLTVADLRERMGDSDAFGLALIPGEHPFLIVFAAGTSVSKILSSLERDGAIDRTKFAALLGIDTKGMKG